MRSTFKLLFYINRQKIKKNGKCPVMGRITLDGKVSQYSTGEDVQPNFGMPIRAVPSYTDRIRKPP